MNGNTIHNNSINPQHRRQEDAGRLMDRAKNNLLRSLISDYGKRRPDDIECWADDFSISDKRLVLAYYEEDEDLLARACENEFATEALFAEYQKSIQRKVDELAWEEFCDHMHEAGFTLYTCRDHGDSRWVRG